MNSEQETLPNNEQILKAINDLRSEMNDRFERVDKKFEDMRLQLMSFDVRIDRIEALTHEVLKTPAPMLKFCVRKSVLGRRTFRICS